MDKALLTRATSKEDSPTPGYLYGEIARMTQHSYDTCSKVLDFLITRVKNKHHTIKFKALQVIKHVCRDGRVDFKREMQKHIPTIKECLQFRGPPDPLKGDEYYRRVRDSAKDVLDAIYDTDSAPGLVGMGMSARIQGVGNPADAAPGSSGWSAKIWGKGGSSGDNLPTVPTAGGPMPSYGAGGAPQYGYPTDPNQGGYAGPQAPNAYGQQQQQPPYQPEYPPSYGGPSGPNAPAPYGGGPTQYGAPPAPYNDQKFSGIGNPMYQDARDEKGFFAGLKEKAASKFAKTDGRPTGGFSGAPPGMANAPDGWTFPTNRGPTSGIYGQSNGSYNPDETYRPSNFVGGGYRAGSAAYGGASDTREVVSTQLREKSYDGDRKKGRVGGAWGDAPDSAPPAPLSSGGRDANAANFGGNVRETRQMSRGSSGPDYGYDAQQHQQQQQRGPPSSAGAYAQPAMTGQTSGAQSDGAYERNLVTALCAPGGMRAIPPKDKLDAFIKAALTLDAEIVGPILEDCLADAQWTVVSKALATIDALLKADGCDDFFDYFSENVGEIEACAQSDKAAVRDRAVKILSALGQSTSAAPTASVPARQRSASQKARGSRASSGYQHHQQQQQPQADLLGDFSDPVAADNGASGIFSGLQPANTSVPQPPPQQQMHQTQASQHDVVDMFGGLSLQSSASTAATAPVAVEAPKPVAPALVLDPLLEPVPTPNPLLAPGFGGLNMNMNMMGYGTQQPMHPQQQQPMHPQQLQQMQYMQQMQQLQYMQQMQQMQQLQGAGGAMPADARARMGSQVIGAAMTPSGYIAKTIHEPPSDEGARGDSGFGFMKPKDDSFNFVMDAMKNS